MNRRHLLLSGLSLAAFAGSARASADATDPLMDVPESQKVGSARLVVLMMPIMDITLYGPQGHWAADRPFALKLKYLRDLKGATLSQRAADEIRHQGFSDDAQLNLWRQQMKAIFPDVGPGDTMTAIKDISASTRFYGNGSLLGTISDPTFTHHFFAICLGPKTSQPDLRRHLLS